MSMRWLPLYVVASLMSIPLVAAAPAHPHGAAKAAKKPVKPGPTRPMDPISMRYRPPANAPTHTKGNMDVPQAKTLADTPDVVLNSKVRAALISDRGTTGHDIVAETVRGVVTLTGAVADPRQRARAEQVARKIHGVKAVKNQLKVGKKK